MIFASDLDRTLIYSKKLINNFDENIVLVERYNGKDLSFMKKRVIETLKEMKKNIIFIPVTTRTLEQYNRIFMISEYIKPKYAIVSNGGNILIDGKIDENWIKIIKQRLENIIHYKFVKKKFLQSFKDISWINKLVLRDNLFFSVHFNDKNEINKEDMALFKNWAEENHWRVSVQEKKLYIIPSVVNKWDAVFYIKNMEKRKKIISAGDSALDYPILINAEISMCASHGELFNMIKENEVNKGNISLTHNVGIDASDEIIRNVEEISFDGFCRNI